MESSSHIDRLCNTLGLSQYQSEFLKSNIEKYDAHGIVKRGGVLYVPHRVHGFMGGIVRLVRGTVVDQIGQDRVLGQDVRRITLTGLVRKQAH